MPVSTQELVDALGAAAASFEPGELVYLALTSKPEHAIRDRLAWALMGDGRCVAREWRERCDLAVLDDDGEPLLVLESKATYTHDTRWSLSPAKLLALRAQFGGESVLETIIRSDAAKVLRLKGHGEGYLLLVSMHRADAVPPSMRQLISEGVRPVRDRTVAEAALVGYLAPLGSVSDVAELGDGEAFGIRMTVSAWLCGPVRPMEMWPDSRV